jgi:hypothetical protein
MSDDKIHHLSVVKAPTIPERTRAETVEILEEVLKAAKAGEVSEVVIIALSPNGEWRELATATTSVAEWIGRLKILESDWIDEYKAARDADEDQD